MSKFWFYTIIFLLITTASFGQSDKQCKGFLKKELSFNSFENNAAEFLQDFKTLVDCEFEPIDYQIFLGPGKDNSFFISTLVIMQNLNSSKPDKTKFTYGSLKQLMQEFKKTPEYLQVREIVETSNILFPKVASLGDWKTDSLMLIKMNFEISSIKTISGLVSQSDLESLTYAELLSKNQTKIFPEKGNSKEEPDTIKTEIPDGMIHCTKGILAYNNYNLAKRKAIENNKPILLYFTSYGCVNSREVENRILSKPKIQDLINSNFTLVELYVDDRSIIPENEIYFSEILKRKVKYKGDIASEMQIRDFGTNAQPLFILFNSEFQEERRIAFTLNEKDFYEFLSGQKKE